MIQHRPMSFFRLLLMGDKSRRFEGNIASVPISVSESLPDPVPQQDWLKVFQLKFSVGKGWFSWIRRFYRNVSKILAHAKPPDCLCILWVSPAPLWLYPLASLGSLCYLWLTGFLTFHQLCRQETCEVFWPSQHAIGNSTFDIYKICEISGFCFNKKLNLMTIFQDIGK